MKEYKIIYADPAWKFGDKLTTGGAEDHYETLSVDQIIGLKPNSADNSFCFLWTPNSFLKEGIEVLEGWGFSYKTIAFIWLKRYQNGKIYTGMGRWTRQATEICLLGIKGKPKRLHNNVNQMIIATPKQHSRKPDITRLKIIQLVGYLPRIELFARINVPGWDAWGNDEKLKLKPLEAY